ncbi:tetratricopeptide repeat protein [Lysobacter sp. KIS68-7]|uniref:tetratricopeptide repeat protein n=1 Tax=Lysobacter sp. KIS68-7 TaxID=2904252 RepID=UPI001E450015|nr:tetratricopeptide repeat protein [Lysobacter sp. KIS68-7]UHQ19442.1 tetratricopeptide repeat protein [Lysobacter sp. KIS68-7]
MSPLLILSVALQIACAVHVVRTGRPMYWIFILLVGSFIGIAVYFFAEILPNIGSSRTARRAVRGVRDRVDPEHGKRRAARQLEVADTLDNRRRLAEQSMASGDYQQALALYQKSLTGLYKTDPDLMLGVAQAQFALSQPAQARATLDALIAANPNFRSSEGHLLYARAVEATGDIDAALHEYDAVAQDFPGEEGRVRYAQLLKRAGQRAKAAEVFNESIKRTSLAPKYYQRDQRAWVDLAKRELQDLA